jgi:hypothetical protein
MTASLILLARKTCSHVKRTALAGLGSKGFLRFFRFFPLRVIRW